MINHGPVAEKKFFLQKINRLCSLKAIFFAFKKADWFVEDEDIRLILIISGALTSSTVLNNAKAFFEIIDLLSQPPGGIGRFLSNLFPYLANKASRQMLNHILNLIPELVKVKNRLMGSWWRLVGPRNRLFFVESHLEVVSILLQLLQVSDGHVVG